MANMSYCRFENTAGDLQDCYDNMDVEALSENETKSRQQIIKLCCEMARDYGHEIGYK